MPESLFLVKLHDVSCNFIEKETLVQVFCKILQNFYKHFFLQNTSDGCFWLLKTFLQLNLNKGSNISHSSKQTNCKIEQCHSHNSFEKDLSLIQGFILLNNTMTSGVRKAVQGGLKTSLTYVREFDS